MASTAGFAASCSSDKHEKLVACPDACFSGSQSLVSVYHVTFHHALLAFGSGASPFNYACAPRMVPFHGDDPQECRGDFGNIN